MLKKLPLFLATAWLATGCAIQPDTYDERYSTRLEFGYYYGLPAYQMPFAYYRRCYGIFGPDGSCLYYRPPYVPVPGSGVREEPVIPLTQPPVMAVEEAPFGWYTPPRQPARVASEPRVRSYPSSRSEPRSTPRTTPRSTPRSTSRSTPRSTPRPSATRSAPKPSSRSTRPAQRPEP